MSSFNECIPDLPIHILCKHHTIIETPCVVGSFWRDQITPKQRWKLLNLIEFVLLNSVLEDYKNENRNKLLEVAYIVEKTMFATAKSIAQYESVVMFPRRVCAIVWTYARRIAGSIELDVIDGLRVSLLRGNDRDGRVKNCQLRRRGF